MEYETRTGHDIVSDATTIHCKNKQKVTRRGPDEAMLQRHTANPQPSTQLRNIYIAAIHSVCMTLNIYNITNQNFTSVSGEYTKAKNKKRWQIICQPSFNKCF